MIFILLATGVIIGIAVKITQKINQNQNGQQRKKHQRKNPNKFNTMIPIRQLKCQKSIHQKRDKFYPLSENKQQNQKYQIFADPEILEDPKNLEQIQQLNKKINNMKSFTQTYEKQLQKLKEQAKKNSDPKTYNEGRKKAELSFIKNLQKIQIPLSENQKQRKFIIGPISVGKSSILKHFVGAQVKIGRGQTTLQVKCVYQDQNMQIFDSPGINPDYDITKFENIFEIISMDQYFICYNSSLKYVNLILRILSAITKRNGKQIYVVRTQCDCFQEEDFRTLEQEIIQDQKYLQKMFENKQIHEVYPILVTSSKSPMEFKDNKQLLKLLNPQGYKLYQKQQQRLKSINSSDNGNRISQEKNNSMQQQASLRQEELLNFQKVEIVQKRKNFIQNKAHEQF